MAVVMEAVVYAASVVTACMRERRARLCSGAASAAGSDTSCEMDSSTVIAARMTAEVCCTASRLSVSRAAFP